jgi:hypothetical protein
MAKDAKLAIRLPEDDMKWIAAQPGSVSEIVRRAIRLLRLAAGATGGEA